MPRTDVTQIRDKKEMMPALCHGQLRPSLAQVRKIDPLLLDQKTPNYAYAQ
jgi:hypothetical protein